MDSADELVALISKLRYEQIVLLEQLCKNELESRRIQAERMHLFSQINEWETGDVEHVSETTGRTER